MIPYCGHYSFHKRQLFRQQFVLWWYLHNFKLEPVPDLILLTFGVRFLILFWTSCIRVSANNNQLFLATASHTECQREITELLLKIELQFANGVKHRIYFEVVLQAWKKNLQSVILFYWLSFPHWRHYSQSCQWQIFFIQIEFFIFYRCNFITDTYDSPSDYLAYWNTLIISMTSTLFLETH